ncbi:hypothetical protein EDB19DRAFT_2010067, partial [Suillus lakei]
SSTHNTRIERLWVEVGRQFARRWKGFFIRLERLHGLNRKNPHHLWLLHSLFLDLINVDCSAFIDEWNHHPISGVSTKNQSPADLRFLSEIENGVYLDDPLEDIHPDLLARYHGTGGPSLSSEDQDDADEMHDLRDMIVADLEENLNGEPVPVPKHANPFPSFEAETIFHQALTEIREADIMPDSPYFPASQWNLSTYDTHEDITVGFRKMRSLVVHLPPEIWMPRALLWSQALSVLQYLLLEI